MDGNRSCLWNIWPYFDPAPSGVLTAEHVLSSMFRPRNVWLTSPARSDYVTPSRASGVLTAKARKSRPGPYCKAPTASVIKVSRITARGFFFSLLTISLTS